MQALDPCDHFHWLFNSNTPSETDFSPLLAARDSQDSQDSSSFLTFSAFSTSLGSTPRKLREWQPVDWSFDPKLDPKLDLGASPLGWRALELSPLVQAFLPAKINSDNLNPALTEYKDTEGVIDEVQSSAFNTLDSRNSSFDMSTFSSTLSLSHPTKSHSRSQSRFHSLFQSMKSDSDSDMVLDIDSGLDLDLNMNSKSPPKGNLITQSTMDFLFGGCIPCDAETIGAKVAETIWEITREPIWENAETIWENGETIWENTETIWENGGKGGKGETMHQAHASPWDPPKSHPKLWDPFEKTDSTPTPAWGFVDPELTENSEVQD